MGITKQHIHVFCMEQARHSVIRGDVLTLGQQTVFATQAQVESIIARYKQIDPKPLPAGFDTAMKIAGGVPNSTNADTVLTLLGAESVYVTDVSAYESPDFVFDLNEPVDPVYHERFDTVLDVGTLEHVFDTAVALDSIRRMVKPGGSVVLVNPSSNVMDHGFYSISPTLYWDYFSANGFSDMCCYLIAGSTRGKARLFRYHGVECRWGLEVPMTSSSGIEIAFTARKSLDGGSREAVKPMQSLYTETESWQGGLTEDNSPPALLTTKQRIERLMGDRKVLREAIARRMVAARRAVVPPGLLRYGHGTGSKLEYLGRY